MDFRRLKGFVVGLVVVGLSWMLAGCATTRPWEREYLADPTMSFVPGSQLVFEAREGSAGAFGAGGGGCACKR